MSELLTKEQREKLGLLIEKYRGDEINSEKPSGAARMSQEFVDEKMKAIEDWMRQIDEGELYLNTEEYEDYSAGYWDSDWITDYYDEQGIGDKIISMARFAKDCMEDCRYEEANCIYEWLWGMFVSTDSEYDGEPVNLEGLVDNEIISADLKQLALSALYAEYQVRDARDRAEALYSYFSLYPFKELHIEDVFCAGRENPEGTDQFWKDWIALLKTKSGSMESRLL